MSQNFSNHERKSRFETKAKKLWRNSQEKDVILNSNNTTKLEILNQILQK